MTTTRLLYLVSHPIQYQAPLLRRIAAEPGVDLHVLFESMETAAAYHDEGFGGPVEWDVPLTDGYSHEAVQSLSTLQAQVPEYDALWVHGWDTKLKRQALGAAKAARVPTLMRGENNLTAMPDGSGFKGWLKRRYLARIFRVCDAFLCIGSDNRRYYESHGVAHERLFSMPYAVDNEFFRGGDAAQAKAELGLEPGRPVVLFAGKLQARKHPDVLTRAFAALDREACGNPYLLFAGDGEMKGRIEASDDVRLLGFKNQSELPALYALADVFVLASSREPWGLAVNEAMNGGAAIVASHECGCAADLVDASVGRVVAPGDAEALTTALTDILAHPDAMAAMGRAAKEKIAAWDFEADVDGLNSALAWLRRA